MIILSQNEAEELLEHLRARPDIWVEHNGVWARRCEDSYGLALAVRNGQPHEMFSLIIKPVTWQPSAAEEYVLWLLDKYTAYMMRQKIVSILERSVKSTADVNALSRDLCDLHGGPFTRKHMR